MSLIEIVLIAVGLAMDAFAVSVAAGASGRMVRFRPAARLAFHLGWFQFMMPVIGWFAGSQIAGYLIHVDHWIAFVLLAWIGGKMLHSGLCVRERPSTGDPSRGLTLVALSVATSIDAFAIGLTLAMLGVGIWFPSAVIGVITATLSIIGIHLGTRLGLALGRRMEVVGGLILLGIGLRILITHLVGGR